jgi:hypothetical protein
MTEQVQVAMEPGAPTVELFDSLACLSRTRRHRVDVTDRLNGMLEASRGGRLECSLLELAMAVDSDVETARRAVAALDPTDHVLSVDILNTPAEERFSIRWAPVTGVIDLLLDWDLLTVEITVGELSEWLGVPPATTGRALCWLAVTSGVTVRERADDAGTVHIAVAPERCPLTAEVPAAVR